MRGSVVAPAIIAVLELSGSSQSQDKADAGSSQVVDERGGWNFLRWGMSRPEVEKALSDAYGSGYARREERLGSYDVSVDYRISERIGSWQPAQLTASFFEGKLYRVNLGGRSSWPGMPIVLNGSYGDLRDALAEKYPQHILDQNRSYFYDYAHKTTVILKPSHSSLEVNFDVAIEYLDQTALIALDAKEKAAKAVERQDVRTKL